MSELFTRVVFLLLVVGAFCAPPPLPYNWWQMWTVASTNYVDIKGNAKEVSSFGWHSVVNQEAETFCRHGMLELFPIVQNYSETNVLNYTAGYNHTRLMNDDGTVTNCSSVAVAGKMPFGGHYDLAPTPEIFNQMIFIENTSANGENCSLWQWQGFDPQNNRNIVQWYVSWIDFVPQIFVNQTFFLDPKSGNSSIVIHTTAFIGYEEMNYWPFQCVEENICGDEYCAANMAVGAPAIQAAVSWICGGNVDCTNISIGGPFYYPNTLLAHATWAFDQYFLANAGQGASACDFNGAGLLTICGSNCTTCNASKTASEEVVLSNIAWICNTQYVDCSPILPGGPNFLPNTTQHHADWAYNVYYQAYKCVPQTNWCDFNSTGVVVSCV